MCEKVASSISLFGFCDPLLVGRDNELIDVEARYQAAKHLGLDRVRGDPRLVGEAYSPHLTETISPAGLSGLSLKNGFRWYGAIRADALDEWLDGLVATFSDVIHPVDVIGRDAC